MARRLNVIPYIETQAVRLDFPTAWNAQETLLCADPLVDLPSMIADSTKRECPNRVKCGAGGSTLFEGGKLLVAMVTCQVCEIGT